MDPGFKRDSFALVESLAAENAENNGSGKAEHRAAPECYVVSHGEDPPIPRE